jgi:hypothetical protein
MAATAAPREGWRMALRTSPRRLAGPGSPRASLSHSQTVANGGPNGGVRRAPIRWAPLAKAARTALR